MHALAAAFGALRATKPLKFKQAAASPDSSKSGSGRVVLQEHCQDVLTGCGQGETAIGPPEVRPHAFGARSGLVRRDRHLAGNGRRAPTFYFNLGCELPGLSNTRASL